MIETRRLSPAPPPRTSLDYAALREAGLELIRELAGESWTDHNAHDPGITLLEAFSYAMTELGFRIQLDLGDLVASGEAHAPAALVPAHRVLPSGPVTVEDLRRLLLDHPLVADALIAVGVEGEVRFYEEPSADPPFSYDPGPPPRPRARPRGLFEVMTAFAGDSEQLNSNTYEERVDVGGMSYTLELALPHWDEEQAAAFRRGASATAVQMVDPGTGVWRPLAEPASFFGELSVAITGPAGAISVEAWVLLRVAEELAQPAAVLPGILASARTRVEATGPGSLIERFAGRALAAQAAVDRVERYLASWRNLGEDPVRLGAARVQEIAVGARIEVTGGSDLERLLADVFLAIDRMLSPSLRFHSLAEMRARGKSVEEILDGPLLRQGFLDRDEVAGLARPAVIYASDVLRLIMRRRSSLGDDLVAQENPGGREIVAVTDLVLSNFVNNRPVTTDARDCLRLVETDRYRPRLSLAKSRVVFLRDDVEVGYDRRRVEELFDQGRRRDREAALPADPSPVLPAPAGEALPIEDYTPFQYDLPRLYGVGEAGLPASAGLERRSQALQVKGYLLLFEQFLADATAQLGGINRFFSPDPDEPATYFPRPLLDLPGVAELLTRFAPGGDFTAFAGAPDNPHRRALGEAAEGRDRFLDRRNRMLDHLLARQGEEAVAWGQELHRRARNELSAAGLAPAVLGERMAARRQDVNARLVRDKAAMLADAPELAALRLQAFGTPAQRRPGVVGIEPDGTALRWTLTLDGEPLLRSLAGAGAPATAAAAGIAAEEAAVLAAQPAFYTVTAVPGGRRYRLRDGAGAGAREVGESPARFPTVGAAQDAAAAVAARFAALAIETSLTPMERRLAHLTGIRERVRRPLAVPAERFFEIVDAAAGDGVIDAWRLRELPGAAGEVLLESAAPFTAPSDAGALVLARGSIDAAARWGLDEWSYAVAPAPPPAPPGSFAVELRTPAGDPVARPPAPFPSRAAAEQAVAVLVGHLHRHYSAEGVHLVEHLLLRPRQDGDAFLSLPAGEKVRERDPYSQRLTLVFPSGWARDSAGPPNTPPTPAAPHRFRDPEFRRHAERVVRQSCPAHLLPAILWVDRDLATQPSAASFEGFEERYLGWLASVVVPGADPIAARTARNELVAALNAIADP